MPKLLSPSELETVLKALRLGADYIDGAHERYALEVHNRDRYPSDSLETQFDQHEALMKLAVDTVRRALTEVAHA